VVFTVQCIIHRRQVAHRVIGQLHVASVGVRLHRQAIQLSYETKLT
jgi:hypothetical protein